MLVIFPISCTCVSFAATPSLVLSQAAQEAAAREKAEQDAAALAASKARGVPTVGDGGASWRKRALMRAMEQVMMC